ncbi:serine/threonine protein kinase [Rhodococcus opacus M213]|uniref:Serine/threonine-protein kinase PknK n=1 Tax=Rhodococcus opacus M213 TaxID=1129896 RepID=K8XQT9_RHOOP|nr:serine/threonine-protein kinase [Rhodococcus opacus]EKT83849.1 serine/threonine protein kinase [Rhodococcus opacus M213]
MTNDDPWATQRQPEITTELAAAGFDDAVEIGRGGFGVVYRCLQEDLDRTVAVKVLTSNLDPDNVTRFVREQRAMGRTSGHPNIVAVYQVGVTRSRRPFLVMPYHSFGSLDVQIRRSGPLGWQEVLRLGIKMSGALETAHRGGMLHRDVKPANILLTEYDEPQLTDFGIARVSGGFETTAGSITGSPAFTAPEVLEGRPPTVESDVYSLGSTLFCALTGHAAYERRSGEQVVGQFLRISRQAVPDLRDAGIPDDVCSAVEHAMARAVEDRPGGAADFGNELRAVERRNGVVVDDMYIPVRRAPEQLHDHAGESTRSRGPGLPYNVRTPPTPPAPVTKFRPPTTTRQLVPRRRLLAVLRAGRDRRLTLVHAPAGFGKSSLVAQWRDDLVDGGTAVAWLTVDRDDNNVVWFLTHLVEAIRRVRPEVVTDLGQSLEEHGDAVERFVLTSLINRLHDSEEALVVVIDDWHRITGSGPIDSMKFLLDNGCHHLKIVVASRSRSGLPLSRMRVLDELNEIASDDLCFDFGESQNFLSDRVQVPLKDTEIEQLRESTDGWIAALQLASLSLREAGTPENLIEQLRTGTDAIGEYLAENVLDALEPDMLDFMLATSVPDKVCGDLASALGGVQDGQAKLEQVVARDLFLGRTGDDRQWYRYHHLFAQILHQRLERDHPGRITDLHRRAYDWFRKRHLLGEAVDHILAAGEPQRAVELLEEDDLYLLDRSQMSTLLCLIGKLPADLVDASPRLQLTIGWANCELQRLELAQTARTRALEQIDSGEMPERRAAQLRVEADVLQGDIEVTADRIEGVRELVTECLAHPTEYHPFVVSMAALIETFVDTCEFRFEDAHRRQSWAAPYHRQNTGPYSVAYGYCFAGLAKFEQLDVGGAMELYRKAFQLVREAENTQSQHARLTRALLAEVHYEQARVDEADELLNETFDAAALGGAPDFMIRHYCLRARIMAVRGDRDGAARQLDEGVRTAETFSLPRLRAAVDNERVRIGLPPAPGFVPVTRETRRTPANGLDLATAQLEEEAAITLLAARGDPADADLACEWANDWVRQLDGTGRHRACLQAVRLLVSCLWAAGRRDEAQAMLLPAAVECARHGLNRFLPDGGPNVVAALSALRENGHPDLPRTFVDTVLAAAQ